MKGRTWEVLICKTQGFTTFGKTKGADFITGHCNETQNEETIAVMDPTQLNTFIQLEQDDRL